MPRPQIVEADDLDGGPAYPIITGDYASIRTWARHAVVPGTVVPAAAPVFVKLDPSVIDDELSRLSVP